MPFPQNTSMKATAAPEPAPTPHPSSSPSMSITYLEAIREAQARALAEDPRVFIYGQDVGNFSGAFITASGGLSAAITRFKTGLDSGSVYLNIHTSTFGGGEIRGFMLVPEPSSAALVLLAMTALGVAGARSRRA